VAFTRSQLFDLSGFFGETRVAEHIKRAAVRHRTLITARIAYGDGAFSTECTVNNLSTNGAQVSLPHSIGLTDQFDVTIPQKDISCRARLVWRKDGQAGIEFLERNVGPLTPGGDERQNKMKSLEAENAKLKAELSFLRQQVQRLTDD
jgi:hypothetical protein